MSSRIGWFFIIVGSVLLLIFFASDLAKETSYEFLCLGMLAVVFGLILWNKGKPKPQANSRFNSIRKMRDASKTPKRPNSKNTPPPT
ncbi:MAG TPA: hypothetical protein VF326_00405 [Anaerolineaceae bacterium]